MKDNKKKDSKEVSKNGSPRQNRRERRSNRTKDDKSSFYKETPGSNKIEWHTPDAELLHRSASIPWSFQTGELVQINRPLITVPNAEDPKYASQAGFMVIHDALGVGGMGSYFNYQSQPTYMAANSLLTTMRARARVRNTYDAPDIMMLMVAMDNIYSAVAFAKRLAATVQMYTYQNHYMPTEMLKAQGIDPDWMAKNQYTFVTQLNVLISEINKIYVPNRMHLFELHNSRFSNYYTEGTSIKDQIYFFTPAFLSQIDYNATEDYQSIIKPILCLPGTVTITDGKIVGTTYNASSLITGDLLLDVIRQMVTAVIEHDSTADITGDMENAFGTSERWILTMCDPSAVAAPIFDEEILETIHNATVLYGPRAIYQSYNTSAGPMNRPYFSVLQDVNTNRIGMYDFFAVQKNNSIASILNAEASFTLVDVHRDPSPEKTFEILRCRPMISSITADDTNYIAQIEFGADLIVNITVHTFVYNNGVVPTSYGVDSVMRATYSSRIYAALAPFHYAPLTKLLDTNYAYVSDTWYMGSSDIYSIIPDIDTVKNMNRLSLLTLLGAYNNM